MTDPLPLAGIRVVDFSWIIAGPTCTRYLALMGAEVLKVESERRPDPTRRGNGASFHLLNQSKKGVSLNLATQRGLELARQLVSVSDVVIENFATGVIERLGLGYDVLAAERSDLVMLSSSGLGHTGPDRNHVAYGTLLQCFTGWSSLTGYPGSGPVIGGVWSDPITGMLQTFLIVSALHHRARTGQGQYIDFSMAEAMCTMLPEAIMEFAMNGRVLGPNGNEDPMYAPHDLYPCQGDDQWIAIAVTTEEQWRSFCHAMGQPELVRGQRFSSVESRRANKEALDDIIAAWTRNMANFEIMERLQAAGVPAGPSMNAVDVYNDPHLEARGFFLNQIDQEGQKLRLPGLPWRFRPGPQPDVWPAPALGQHNSYLLGELLGLSKVEIQALVNEQVIY